MKFKKLDVTLNNNNLPDTISIEGSSQIKVTDVCLLRASRSHDINSSGQITGYEYKARLCVNESLVTCKLLYNQSNDTWLLEE